MPVTATPIYPQTITVTPQTIAPGDTTTKKTLYTAGTNGSRVENIAVTNTDTNPYTLNIYITQSSTAYLMGTINLPASSGNTTSAASLNLLANSNFVPLNYDSNGNRYLYLSNGSTLQAAVTSTVASGKTVTFLSQGGDY